MYVLYRYHAFLKHLVTTASRLDGTMAGEISAGDTDQTTFETPGDVGGAAYMGELHITREAGEDGYWKQL
jgi:hypothetical protein